MGRRAALALLLLCFSNGPAAVERPDLDGVRAAITAGRFDEAERLARDLLARAETAHGPESPEAAQVLDLLVESLWRAGKVKERESHEFAERAVSIRERAGTDEAALAVSLRNRAMLLRESGDLEGAKALYERTLALQEKALGRDHPDLAPTLTGLGVLLRRSGDYAAARPFYERALEIREKALGSDHPEAAASLNNLAVLLREMGDYDGARPLYERALAIREKVAGPEDLQLAQMLSNMASFLRNTGNYPGALESCERALEIRERAVGPDHFTVGDTLDTLGAILATAGDRAEARRTYERALMVREKARGADHPDVATTLNNLAELLRESGDPGAARPLHERALAIYERALGPDHPNVAACVNNLANLDAEAGRYAEAKPLYERAVSIAERSLGPSHPALAQYLQNLAVALDALGDPVGARSCFERALAIREDTFGPAHPIVAETLESMATGLARSGEVRRALDVTLRAEQLGRDHLRLLARAMSEREALHYAAVRRAGLDVALTLAAEGRLDPASLSVVWDSLIRSRSLVLDEMVLRHRAAASASDPALDRLRHALSSARQRLANLTVRGPGGEPPERYRAVLDSARREKEQADRALAQASSANRAEWEREQVGLEQVEQALPRESVLISYARYRHSLEEPRRGVPSYVALVLSARDRVPVVIPLGPAVEIDAAVEVWKATVSVAPSALEALTGVNETETEAAGSRLRRAIWDPCASRAAGARRVFVVPDGVLHTVSVAALPTGSAEYLVDRAPILHYLSAERDIVVRNEPRRSGLLVLGGPDYDRKPIVAALAPNDGGNRLVPGVGDSSLERGDPVRCGNYSSLSFDPLPGALREARDVSRVWKKGRAEKEDVLELTGSAATEEAFKARAHGPGVLHLATHGFSFVEPCASSTDDVAEKSPLLFSGLAMAGANQRASAGPDEEDGILTAEEIAALDLSGVEWAVLSACDTGVGETAAGDGVLGLRRAFQLAGAQTLIMSLWPVEDEATREWMVALYRRRIHAGLDTAEAVHEASLEVLRKRRAEERSTHPYYWAGFVAVGNWR